MSETIRLDKWLWQARFFKSRSLSAGVVSAGKVRVDGTPVSKPARTVKPGDVLTFPQAEQVKVEIGDSAGDLVAVRGDLAKGDRVAIRGAENLSAGSDVKILVSETSAKGDAEPTLNSSG